jgi:hypothetical protein
MLKRYTLSSLIAERPYRASQSLTEPILALEFAYITVEVSKEIEEVH